MLDLRTSNFQGAAIRVLVLRRSYCRYCSPLKFSSAREFKNHVEIFLTFLDESCESQCKI